jgi:hypothetical protein
VVIWKYSFLLGRSVEWADILQIESGFEA